MTEPRPRVAVLADWWWPDEVGGAERSARAAARELAGFADVSVFVPSTTDNTYADGPLTVHAVRRPFARRQHADTRIRRGLEFLTAWLLPLVAFRLTRRIRTFRPDVVVATNISRTGPWLPRWVRARGLRYVRVFHDLSDTCWRRSRLKDSRTCVTLCGECRVKAGIMRGATPRGAVGVCVSGFVRDELAGAGLTTPAASLVGYPLVGPPEAVRPARRVDETQLVVGYLGRLDPVKGIESAIRTAGAHQRSTGTPVRMLVAGEGQPDYTRTLAELARSEGVDLHLAGHLTVDAFCDAVDVVLIPSRWMEPFGRVAVEVGRTGKPMLVAPLGGLPEAAAVSGGVYAYADFQDPAAAAAALGELLAGAAPPIAGPGGGAATTLPQAVVAATRRALSAADGVTAGRRP
ncbi:glycosyltransferase [Micromonospora halotolerans]|uniref:Glycosyltransferase n=1 Tax=Micromonospora halotolerans TaxID=709879 RepID=A0ABZ0A044_9ACTN|nr:glycosyltransferase [Micromonospora halotolerans]WNM40787.1 glycosyltransferase [Micromonospora halotolerans]